MNESDVRDPHARRAVVLMERDQLEDKHLRLMEENLILKKHARSQEEKMKKMATKLIRLTSDEKKETKRDGQWITGRGRDLGVEERVDELQAKVRELEKQNITLKSKSLVLRQQLETKGKRHSHYDHIQSRISTGLSRKSQRSISTEDVSGKSAVKSVAVSDAATQSSVSPAHVHGAPCHNLLEEVRRDNQELEETTLQLRQELTVLRAENGRLKEQVRVKSLRSEEEKLSLQEELQAHITALEKNSADDEVKLMRLQREMRDKANRLQSLQAKYNTLEQNIDAAKLSHSRVLQEMELLNEQLKEERSRNTHLQSELRSKSVSQKAMTELQEMLGDIRAERDLLKQTNDRLMKGDVERREDQRSQQRSLQERVRQLEEANRQHGEEKATAVDRLSRERELSEKLNGELTELRVTYYQLKEEHQQLQDKMKFYSKETSLDWGEVEEALALVREKKENGEPLKSLSFLETLEDSKEHHRELQELRVAHADTINELEKTRRLLQLQHNINKDYKKEIESLNSQQAETKLQHDSELREYAQLLDIKSARIKKLEGQLKDIAYGTRQYKLDTSKFEYEGSSGSALEESIELERGQNLLQFHISQVILSPEVISQLHTPTPAVFTSLHFSDFETQVTSVKQGARPCFNYTSNYVVTVNDSFLQRLQKSSILLEVNQALGLKYQKLAVTSVKSKELITSSGGKVHGKALLTGVDSLQECVSVGTVEYWMRLKLPITQAVRLYQERGKALSLVEDQPDSGTAAPVDSKVIVKGPDYNELVVTVDKCRGLMTSTSGQSPSAYVMYKFYTFPDHDTPIIPHSSEPLFSDSKLFPVSMDLHLDRYLKEQSLELYVFDDRECEESSYVLARVPLLPLAQGRTNITDTFTLTQVSGEPSGEIAVSLKWKHPYHIRHETKPTSSATTTTRTHQPISKQPTFKAVLTKPKTPKVHGLAKVKDDQASEKRESVSTSGVSTKEGDRNGTTGSALKSSSQTSLEGQPSSSTLLTESDDTTPLVSEESQVSLTDDNERDSVSLSQPVVVAVAPAKTGADKSTKAPSLPQKKKKGVSLATASSKAKRTTSIPLNNSLPPLTAKVTTPVAKEAPVNEDVGQKHAGESLIKNRVVTAQQSLGDSSSSSDLVDVTDSEMSLMSGLELNTKEDTRKEKSVDQSKVGQVVRQGEPGEGDESGEGSEVSDGGSVTVTEVSEEEEEIEEDIDGSGEDTMFEETPQQSGDEDVSSGLSEHSSDGPQPPSISHPLPLSSKGTDSESTNAMDGSETITAHLMTESKLVDGKPITSNNKVDTTQKQGSKSTVSSSFMSITIESFTLEDDSTVAMATNVTDLFVEYSFLNYEYGELETPGSLPKPPPGEAAVYNFRKEFYLDSDQERLLSDMLKPGDPSEGRITFTVVSDPDNDDTDCEELGNAEVDLKMIIESGKDLVSEAIDVYSIDEDTEIIGYLIVSVEVSELLRELVKL